MKYTVHNMTGQVFHVVARVNGVEVNRSVPGGGSLLVDELNPIIQALIDRKRFVVRVVQEVQEEQKSEKAPKSSDKAAKGEK